MLARFALFLVCWPALAVTLYTPGTLPGTQGWITVVPLGATETLNPAYVEFNSLAPESLQGGYSRFGGSLPVTLDLTTGFRLTFDLQILAETHAGPNGPNRAGFSLIALGAGSASGIELGFWTDQVWAQNAGFTKGESAAFNTTTALTRYDLFMNTAGYALYANNTLLLSGSLRTYGTPLIPYSIANYLFVGDNTTSAGGQFRLGQFDFEPVPEPGTFGLLAAGCLALFKLRRT